ncbi:MAG: ParB/RepB/Spo0J family partition protein [Bacteroidaceae bacterium]|nr:ParB/RepB/Spo0J family partition protein [Bacteroidaceae bacterium]
MVLGRGLDSLISDDVVIQASGSDTISEVAIDLIDPNKNQPRKDFDDDSLNELTESIKNIGLIQPITLRKTENGRYQIIAGERRYRACKLAKLKTIPSYVRQANDQTMMAMALVENIQRQDLNAIEIALAYQNLIESYNITQEQLSERIGKKRATVANYVRLLKLPADVQMALQEQKIDMGHARALLSLDNAEMQLKLFHEILDKDYSVRKVEERVHAMMNQQNDVTEQEEKQDTAKPYASFGKRLTKLFGQNVKLKCNQNGKGFISIPFKDKDDLKRIMEIFGNLK